MKTAIKGAGQRGNHGRVPDHSPHLLRASSEPGAKTGSKEPIQDRERLSLRAGQRWFRGEVDPWGVDKPRDGGHG